MSTSSSGLRFGLVHPGAMGVTVGAALSAGGAEVAWASQGRSEASRRRAEGAGLRDAGELAQLVRQSDVIVSVCPPHAAEALAREVIALGFTGTYLDANAIAPERAWSLAERFAAAGGRFVDGGIVGPPAVDAGTTTLHLSGPDAARLAASFSAGPLGVSVVSERVGDASALKMCYAAYSKGATALRAAQLAAAESLGVRAALLAQWEHDEPGSGAEAEARVRRVTAKAWRFEGEMHEIAATFAAAGLPDGFHVAAAEVYTRLAQYRTAAEAPALEDVLRALVDDR
jgi:3-hydroxyisobutyrate dehydrogenase-like beta-hydroxyacid dehydrogenase